jgi:hypothetical protein
MNEILNIIGNESFGYSEIGDWDLFGAWNLVIGA